MTVLVIGGAGFIGSHVVDALLGSGHSVRVLDRRPEHFRMTPPGVETILGDYAESSLLYEALVDVGAVVHLASATVPATAEIDPEADIRGNLIATLRLLATMEERGVKRLIYLSSGGTVYGIPGADPVPESHPLRPLSSYGIVKATIEHYLAREERRVGLRSVVLRPSNPYGPRQGHRGVQGVIGTFLWRAAQGEPIEIWGDGSVVRDYLHVADLADLTVRALATETTGTFNAGSGRGASVIEVLDIIRRTVGRQVELRHLPGRRFDVPRIVLDISAARGRLGWAPAIPLERGIEDAWRWVRDVV